MQLKGIDVSHWQKGLNLAQAKAEGNLDFVIIKAGDGKGADKGSKDSEFDNFYKQAKDAGLHVGAYYYCRFTDEASCDAEAQHFVKLLVGKQFDMPVYADIEENSMYALGTEKLTALTVRFCEQIEKAGYFVGIYTSESSFKNRFKTYDIARFTFWVARWNKTGPNMTSPMWQYGGETNLIESNKLCGITVDKDYCYVDFSSAIINKKLNGYGVQVVEKKSAKEVAQEVISGKWGNGQERKDRLTAAGYNYRTIQNAVNKLKKGE